MPLDDPDNTEPEVIPPHITPLPPPFAPTEIDKEGFSEPNPASGLSVSPVDRTPYDRDPVSRTGAFDAFVGIVRSTHYGGVDTGTGVESGIQAERVDVRWDADTNTPLGTVTGSPQSGSSNVVDCKPWPAAHDQAAYQVAEGDIVTIIRGADGLNWYTYDDRPFIGTVVARAEASVTEQYSGGVDATTASGLIVRQQSISGDPTSELATFADLKDTADDVVLHRYVNVLKADNMAHGYRVGDNVLVFKRGLYLFCLPLRETFLARVQIGDSSGPDPITPEDDFTDAHYWVREVDPAVTPATNAWTFNPVDPAFRSITDPTGSGGRLGRWVDAMNLAERTAGTHLLKDGLLVMVSMGADSGEDPYYTFSHQAGGEFWAKIGTYTEVSEGTNQWVYAWDEVHKTSLGYAPADWATFAGNRSGTTSVDPARNTIEVINTGAAAHVEGNGADMDELDTADYTFTLRPCVQGNIVWMREVNVPLEGETPAALEYWFSYESGVSGECD